MLCICNHSFVNNKKQFFVVIIPYLNCALPFNDKTMNVRCRIVKNVFWLLVTAVLILGFWNRCFHRFIECKFDHSLTEMRTQQGTTIALQKQPTSSNSETTAEVEAVVSQRHKTALLTRTLCTQYYFLLILVSSAPGNAARRKDIRKTWGVDFAIKPRWKTVFLVAQTRIQTEEDSLLATEDAFYGDLVRADYYDHYKNQTLKIQMGFEWAARYCKFSFVLKTDDDVFVNTIPLLLYLRNLSYTSREKFFMGNLYKSALVLRSGKWRVSFEEYSRSTYPDFCPGFGYVLSADVVALFVDLFDVVPPFRLDDVYVGMLADKAGVNIVHNEGFIVGPPEVTECILQDNTLVWHGVFGNCLLEVFSQALKEMNHGHVQSNL